MEASVKSVTEPAKFSQVLGLSPGDNLDFCVASYQQRSFFNGNGAKGRLTQEACPSRTLVN